MHRPTPNYLATLLAVELGFGHQVIVGVVVFTGGADSEGNTLPLGDLDLRLLGDIAERLIPHVRSVGQKVAQTTSGRRGSDSSPQPAFRSQVASQPLP